jgi:predicted Rossmann-fold nucleotide-binding protein
MADLASGYIALPGSIGTLAELVVAWNLAFVAPFADKPFGPIATVGETWSNLVPLLNEQLDSDRSYIATFSTVDQAVSHVATELG